MYFQKYGLQAKNMLVVCLYDAVAVYHIQRLCTFLSKSNLINKTFKLVQSVLQVERE